MSQSVNKFHTSGHNLVVKQELYSAPIPSADELAKYETVKPSITDIILST